MDAIDGVRRELAAGPRRWLVTGSAGFIGSHLVEALLALGQDVVGLDNFATGHRRNLDEVGAAVGPVRWARHRFVEADIRDLAACRDACRGIDVVLHQAALGSVPRSLTDPIATNASNVDGFLNMLVAARDAGVRRFVYAASSSTYGDEQALPKVEDRIGRPLSPYAVTKLVNELYADVFGRCYGMESIGLRYFNVFGPRQDPEGAYAAVIPRWVRAMLVGDEVVVNGDGETSRDFCYVENAVQANLLAATTTQPEAVNQIYNVAVDDRTSLNRLFELLREALAATVPAARDVRPTFRDFRPGDVRHSQADIGKARRLLGYAPTHTLVDGIRDAMPWYLERFRPPARAAAPAKVVAN
jgi:UDP-N-acetylglucosamine 4-epimerase